MSSARAIVAGHGEFATGILSAVRQITGREDVFFALTIRDLSATDVERVMREAMDRTGARVIFTDLPAGSCTMAARRLQRAHPEVVVVTGTNLAALLDFLFADDVPSDGDAARHAAEKGRAALTANVPAGPTGGAARGH
jgi:mannose/fructose-specific phosphotransferase system component IIA